MAAIINGQNGKYVIVSATLLGLSVLTVIGYGIKSGYEPHISYRDARLSFSKAPCVAN